MEYSPCWCTTIKCFYYQIILQLHFSSIFLDLSKAFDTVNHEILFEKLFHYGILGVTLDSVKSYFHDRKQFVQFNQSCSRHYIITCGVPQGSMLGPFFFLLLYLNDLCGVSNILKFPLFADDTNIILSGKDPDRLIDLANFELPGFKQTSSLWIYKRPMTSVLFKLLIITYVI